MEKCYEDSLKRVTPFTGGLEKFPVGNGSTAEVSKYIDIESRKNALCPIFYGQQENENVLLSTGK